tara:strand:- start:60 stop:167 length:108 start_codon:yes stop_codon:yes gene_type:complete
VNCGWALLGRHPDGWMVGDEGKGTEHYTAQERKGN